MGIYRFEEANNFSENDLESFKQILLSAEQVREETFPALIQRNPRVVLVYENTIVAIGALKIPNEDYKKGVFKKAQSKEDPNSYKFELGWVVSLAKGNGKLVVKILADVNENLYATTRADNHKMISILKRNGFQQTGMPYKSERDDYQLVLLIKIAIE